VQAIWGSVLRGCAYGDAWGRRNEFLSYRAITAGGERGPDTPAALVITDDSQLTLALARALDGAAGYDDAQLRARVIGEFVGWLNDADNDRAPANTCLRAMRELERGEPWTRALVPRSDGSGALTRVAPAAFLPEGRWQPVAAWQAAVTHGGAAGIAAALVGAAVIRAAAAGDIPAGSVSAATIALCADPRVRRNVGGWLAGHPAARTAAEVDDFLAPGFAAVAARVAAAQSAVPRFRIDLWGADPCTFVGDGWRAAETLAVAALCVDAVPADPIEALRRATVTGGDSDSIAAVAGAILGALHRNPWPSDWDDRLEPRYRGWIGEAERYRLAGADRTVTHWSSAR
jgi:ADP-ribosylglycohydrolase